MARKHVALHWPSTRVHETPPAEFRSGNPGTNSGLRRRAVVSAISDRHRAMFTHMNAWPICNVGWAEPLRSARRAPKRHRMQPKVSQNAKGSMYHHGRFVATQHFRFEPIDPSTRQKVSGHPRRLTSGGPAETIGIYRDQGHARTMELLPWRDRPGGAVASRRPRG